MFDRPLSAELNEALLRAVTACHDNAIHSTGSIEFVCGLYLHYKTELTTYLDGDMTALVQKVFPKHRFGSAGMIPGEVFEKAAADDESCDSGVMYSVSYSDELVRLLWTAARLSNAVGKKPSLKDVIAAVTLDDDCLAQLRSNGVYLKEGVADFRDVLNVVFHATPHAPESWPRLLTFEKSDLVAKFLDLLRQDLEALPRRIALEGEDLESIDTATAPLSTIAHRPTYSSPIAINFNDHLIWTVNPGDNSVSVIRPDNNTRLAKITVGAEPQSLALTPDNQNVYVANAAGSSVTVIKVNDPAWGTFSAAVDTSVGSNGELQTGAEPWNIVCSPDGKRIFVANSAQDTITVISTAFKSILGHIDLRNSIANDPDRSRHFQPRGLAVTEDNTKLYVTRFLSFTKPGGRQGDGHIAAIGPFAQIDHEHR